MKNIIEEGVMPSIYIAVEHPTDAIKHIRNDARELLTHIDMVSLIAEEAGLPRLDEYLHAPLEEIEEFLVGFGATREDLVQADIEVWYDPKEGKRLMCEYITLIENYHSLSTRTKTDVIAELKNFCDILDFLGEENNRWRLQYDI